jgi:signal transduction histidine kinase
MELGRLERAYQAFTRCHGIVVAAHSEAQVYSDICAMMVHDLGYRLAWIGLVSAEDRRVRPVAQAGYEPGYVESILVTWAEDDPHGRGPAGLALRECGPFVAQDITTDERFAPWRDEAVARGYASSAGIPLCSGAARIGVLSLYATEPNAFDDDEIALLEEMAVDLVLSVMRFRYERRLEEAEILVERAARAETAATAAAVAAHDVNNALQLVSLMIADAQSARDEAQRNQSLSEALQTTISTAAMIRQFSSLARHALDFVDHLDVDDVVGPMRELLGRLAPNALLELRLGAVGGRTSMTRQDLERILINLVVNADHSMTSGGTISVSTEHRRVPAQGMQASSGLLPEGSYVEIVVADTGAGIDPEVLPRVFEPYFTTKSDIGTGLGLVSVLNVTRRVGGGVSIESRVGVGTRVSVFLPLTGAAPTSTP